MPHDTLFTKGALRKEFCQVSEALRKQYVVMRLASCDPNRTVWRMSIYTFFNRVNLIRA